MVSYLAIIAHIWYSVTMAMFGLCSFANEWQRFNS